MKNKSAKKKFIISFLLLMVFMLFPLNIITAFADDYTFEQSINDFPNSYKPYLRDLHNKYPNWVFQPLNTNIDWNTAVSAESSNYRNLVHVGNSPDSGRLLRSLSYSFTDKNGKFHIYKICDGNQDADVGYAPATPLAVSYYMDPRNFLNETYIFQFELLTYDSATQTREAVESILSGTFMSQSKGPITYLDSSGNTITTNDYYSDVIINAAVQTGINPCYLASKIRQEVILSSDNDHDGYYDGSGSVSGNDSGYPGLYNFYNINAYDSSTGEAITNGLKYAGSGSDYERTWDTPQKAIVGGAKWIKDQYIVYGQNTQYLQKFNVKSSKPLYTHQYMTSLSASASESAILFRSYNNSGILCNTKTFVIPVFNNMPDNTSTGLALNTDSDYGVISTPGGGSVNLRSVPNTINSSVVASIPNGTQVTILGTARNNYITVNDSAKNMYWQNYYYPLWYKVSVNGKVGYICEEFINTMSSVSVALNSTYNLSGSTATLNTDKPMFMSLDTRVATVDSNGVISPVAIGTTKVVAYTTNGYFSEVNVNVVSSLPDPTPTPPPAPTPAPSASNTITSGIYSISSGVISGINLGTTAARLLSGINEGTTAKIYSNGSQVTGTAPIGTGMNLVNGNAQIVIAVKGDMTGDGKVTVSDILIVKKKLLSLTTLSNAQTRAADLSGDGNITITDFVKLKRILLGLE